MEWFLKLISVLKIPFRILLPTVLLFSAIMTLMNEKTLETLNLLSWREENRSVFGVLLVISFCFCLVYIIKWMGTLLEKTWWKLSFKRRTINKILKLNTTEASIIIKLYNSKGYTHMLDSTQPVIEVLCHKQLIHSGGSQIVSVGYDNSLLMKYMLQPYVIETLDYYKDKLENKIKKTKNKLSKARKTEDINRLNGKLSMFADIYTGVFDIN